jgi:hypothetical protein
LGTETGKTLNFKVLGGLIFFCALLIPQISWAYIGEWKFDGNGNNEFAGPNATTVGSATIYTTGGISGGYAYIPTGTDRIEIPWDAAFDLPNSFTIEFWFRQRSDQSFAQNLVYKGTPTNNYNFYIFRQLWDAFNFGPVIAGFSNTIPLWNQVSNPNQLPHNVWHYVAYRKDTSGHAYYLDGNLIHSSATTDTAIIITSQPIIIGDSAVDTDIDELRISNTALTPTEISDYYHSLTPPTFSAGYPFTANVGNTSLDLTVEIDEDGTAYYVVVDDGAAAPTSVEVKAGTGSGGATAVASGSIALTANTVESGPISGLITETAYDIYVVADDYDAPPHIQSSPIKVDVTTIVDPSNNPPSTPTAVTPANEAIFDAGSADLNGSAFSDADGDTHTKTQWLVRRADRVYGCSGYDASFDYVATTGNLTQHTVSGLATGLKYVWQVGYEDAGSGAMSWSKESTFKVGISVTDSPLPIYPGTEAADYKMASFVHWPDDPAVTSAFGISYDTTNYKIGTYDATTGSYVEYGSNLTIKPGRAYWCLARNGLDIAVTGVPVSTTDDIEVGLDYNSGSGNGWNMIACPNDANYSWDDVQVLEYDVDGNIIYGPTAISALSDPNDYIDKRLWRWGNGSYYSDTTLMEKHEGYWVKAKKTNLFLRFPVSVQARASNPGIMFAGLLNRGKRWMKKWVPTPQVAIADSGDSPPAPMEDFSGSTSGGGSSGGGGGGCFIATAAFGSPLQPQVKILREFRDRFLLTNAAGKTFVRLYCTYSPPIADFIAKHDPIRMVVRWSLLPLVGVSWVALQLGPVPVLVIMLLLLFLMSATPLTGASRSLKKAHDWMPREGKRPPF